MEGGSLVPGHLGEGHDRVTASHHEHPAGVGAEDDRLRPIDPLKDPGGDLHKRHWWASSRRSEGAKEPGDRQATVACIADTHRTKEGVKQLLTGGVAAIRPP